MLILHPWHISHNMGMEGLNKDIKKNHTFKDRVSFGQLFEIINRMLGEWSENPYEHLLEGDCLDHILAQDLKDGQGKMGLARQTDGWKFAHNHRKEVSYKVYRISSHVKNYHTISSEHGLNRVKQMYGIASLVFQHY